MWQFLHIVFEIPFLSLDTRSQIHGVDSSLVLINQRVTSFAEEPSFLAPLMIDFMILSFIVCKKPLIPVLLSSFVLIFSYSGGGYFNIFLIIVAWLIGYLKYKDINLIDKIKKFILNKKTHKQKLFVVCMLIITIFILNQVSPLFYPFFGRFGSMFDINRSSRMFMVVMPFVWILRGSIFNIFFGFGPNSYWYLNRTETFPSGLPLHATSNNLFSDTVFELGYFGLVSYLVIFSQFWITSFKNLYKNHTYFIAFIFSIHLFVTSIYRADFMQPRFWIIFFLILKLIYLGGMDKIEKGVKPGIS